MIQQPSAQVRDGLVMLFFCTLLLTKKKEFRPLGPLSVIANVHENIKTKKAKQQA